MNELIGYLSAALIGLSLGLTGSGGSILTVPILVYLFHLSPLVATSYSLFIVGSTSLVGAINSHANRLIDLRVVLLFGLPSVITVFFTRKFLLPLIPGHVVTIGNYEMEFSTLTMILFALLMVLASISILHPANNWRKPVHTERTVLLYGVGIGLITGFLGAGGGFLLIPALVLLLGIEMKKAVAISLLLITLNSLIGFLGDLGSFEIDWKFLGLITTIAVGGIFAGNFLSKKIKGDKLKKIFGWLVLVMGIYILVKEVLLSFSL
jgi:uncharacterized membrane protein YfcA